MIRLVKYSYELKKVIKFKLALEKFCVLENDIRNTGSNNEYMLGCDPRTHQLYIHKKFKEKYLDQFDSLRCEIAESIPAIRRIAYQIGVQVIRESFPARSVGGPVIPVCIFESVLEDLGYVETQYSTRFDCLNKMIGILKETKTSALINLFNPFNWLAVTLKIPFMIIKATGFNIDKIENGLWGVFIKTSFIILMVWIFLRWGFEPEQLVGILK